MPGLHLIYQNKSHKTYDFETLIKKLKHESHYETKVLFSFEKMHVGFSYYNGYPYQEYTDDRFLIFLEGIIYNKIDSRIIEELRKIVSIIDDQDKFKILIKKFINESDGEYIIFIFDKNNQKFFIINDRWCRLPFYYYHDKNQIVLGRELKFVLNLIPKIIINKEAIVQYLSQNFILGNKTIFQNIYLQDSSQILIGQVIDNHVQFSKIPLFDFKFTLNKSEDDETLIIYKIKKLFFQSLSTRLNKIKEKHIDYFCDLSGGFDTRAVAAGLNSLQQKTTCYTKDLVTGDESEIANQVAKQLNFPIYKVSADHRLTLAGINKVAYLTDCSIDVWTTLTNYNDSKLLKRLITTPAFEFMGFGGEFWRHPYKPRLYYTSAVDLIKENFFSNIGLICSLSYLNKKDYLNKLQDYFSSYQENSVEDQVKHLYYEYYRNLVGLGEDRHRMFFWTVQPLQSKDLFYYSTNCIQPKFINEFFYIKFMKEINNKICDIPIFRSKIPINSNLRLFIKKQQKNLMNFLQNYRIFLTPIRAFLKLLKINVTITDDEPVIEDQKISAIIQKYFMTSTLLSKNFDKNSLSLLLKSSVPIFKFHLLTIFSYLRTIELLYPNKI